METVKSPMPLYRQIAKLLWDGIQRAGLTSGNRLSSVRVLATQHDVSASKRDIRAVAFRVAIANPRHAIVPGTTASVVLPTVRK